MRQPKPVALTLYEEWMAKGPPRFCWNCDNYGGKGECLLNGQEPPAEFTQTEGACPVWQREVPF